MKKFLKRFLKRIRALFAPRERRSAVLPPKAPPDARKHTAGGSATPTSSSDSTLRDAPHASYPRAQAEIERLARDAWKTQEALRISPFLLNPATLPGIHTDADLDTTLRLMLTHARVVAPGLSVPHKVPLIKWSGRLTSNVAGQFSVDSDGWVRIDLIDEFRRDDRISRAILAHEACHYILNNSGIREAKTLDNERLTDLCMFICGFGELFLEGYDAGAAGVEYRQGHHLGYLSESEFYFADRYVFGLRKSNRLDLPDRLEEIKRKLRYLTHNQTTADRLVSHYRARNPGMDLHQVYEHVIEQLLHDRR